MSAASYKAVFGSHLSDADAAVIGKRLEWIAAGGEVTAASVLADAKLPHSPLHTFFEWDDNAAAQKYRLEQARKLVRSVRVVIEREGGIEVSARAFIVVTEGDEDKKYLPVAEVMSDADYREQVIERALHEAESWRARYEAFEEFAGIVQAIEAAARAKQK